MQKFNYHTHTNRCGHAQENLQDKDYVELFIKKGFNKIAFTDHCPHREVIDKRTNMRMKYSELEEYLESVKNMKEAYKGIIDIEFGFEVEYLPGLEEYLLELKDKTDKLVLGQHFIYDDNNKDLKIFRRNKEENLFSDEQLLDYANYIKRAMELNIPDIIVHPDLYMLDRSEFGNIEKQVAEIICKAAEKNNIPLEINLTEASMFLINLRDKISYPCKEFWEIASKHNVKVIYGVDAHYRAQINQYEECIKLVNKIIGEDIVQKLNFCNENLEVEKECC